MRAPPATLSRGFARQAPDLDLPGLDPGLDAGARMLRQEPRQGAVQPLSRQFLRYFELENVELGIHGATRR